MTHEVRDGRALTHKACDTRGSATPEFRHDRGSVMHKLKIASGIVTHKFRDASESITHKVVMAVGVLFPKSVSP